jgi:hypothetical protein
LKQLQAPANVTTQGGPLASSDQSSQLRAQFAQKLAELQRGTPQGPSGNPWRLY